MARKKKFKWATYNKLWVALGVASGVLLGACAPDPSALQGAFEVTKAEWFQVVVAFAGAFGVYQVANK